MEKTLLYSILSGLVALGSIATNSLISGLAVALLGPYGHAILAVLTAVAGLASVVLAQQSTPVTVASKASTPTQTTVTTSSKTVAVQAPVEPVSTSQNVVPATSTATQLQEQANYEKSVAQAAASKAAVAKMLNNEFPTRTSVVTVSPSQK